MQTPPISSGRLISAISLSAAPFTQQRGQHHRRADGDDVGLEQVGGHAGAVADVVADVVGDHRGVAGIVLRNAGLDLADEVGADVGGLGEDAAAETREDRDQRSAEGQRDQRLDHGAVIAGACAGDGRSGSRRTPAIASSARPATSMPVIAPARNASVRPSCSPLARRLGGAHVGADRDVHADEAGDARQHRAEHEAGGAESGRGRRTTIDRDDDADDGDRACTGGADRPARLPGSRRRSPACAALPADARSTWRLVKRP